LLERQPVRALDSGEPKKLDRSILGEIDQTSYVSDGATMINENSSPRPSIPPARDERLGRNAQNQLRASSN
jgi:hypothetical protein